MIFYDFEVFKEDWLAVFIDVTKKKEYVIINNPDELKALYEANGNSVVQLNIVQSFLNWIISVKSIRRM